MGAERDATLVERDEAPIGETDAMGVAPEVAEDLLGSAEGRLGVDDPARAIELVLHAGESRRIGERRGGAVEAERAALVESSQSREELSAKECAEHANGEEEIGTRGDPSRAVERETAAGDDAVHVRVELELARPGVEDAGDAELSAEAVAPELERRRRRRRAGRRAARDSSSRGRGARTAA